MGAVSGPMACQGCLLVLVSPLFTSSLSLPQGMGTACLAQCQTFLKTGIAGAESSDWISVLFCTAVCHTVSLDFLCRCGGTVGAIFTCPLEVIKTRLQSSKLAFRTVYYPQVQLGTISGEGVVRPTSVSPGLLSVLKWVLLPVIHHSLTHWSLKYTDSLKYKVLVGLRAFIPQLSCLAELSSAVSCCLCWFSLSISAVYGCLSLCEQPWVGQTAVFDALAAPFQMCVHKEEEMWNYLSNSCSIATSNSDNLSHCI